MSIVDTKVINIDALKLEHFSKGAGFESRSARIGPLLGAKDLGYSYDVVPPGKRSCPFHSHHGEEEMFFIVKGTGTLRYGKETRRIRAGAHAPVPGADRRGRAERCFGPPSGRRPAWNPRRKPGRRQRPDPRRARGSSKGASFATEAHEGKGPVQERMKRKRG